MANRRVSAGGSRKEGDDKLANVIEPQRGVGTTPDEQKPGREKQAESSPPGEHDQKAAVVCHGRRSRRLYRQPSAPTILKVLVRSLIGLRHPRHPPPSPMRGRAGSGLPTDRLRLR